MEETKKRKEKRYWPADIGSTVKHHTKGASDRVLMDTLVFLQDSS